MAAQFTLKSIENRIFLIDFACLAAVCCQFAHMDVNRMNQLLLALGLLKSCEVSFWFLYVQAQPGRQECYCLLLLHRVTSGYAGKCFFLIFRPESVSATKSILVNTDSTLLLCSWGRPWSNLFGRSCRPPVEKVKLGRDPTVLCINAFCIVVWLFPLCLCIFFNWGDREHILRPSVPLRHLMIERTLRFERL